MAEPLHDPLVVNPSELTLAEMSGAVQEAWSMATSMDPGWRPDQPHRGQSLPTACVVQDYLGGDIRLKTLILGAGTLYYYANDLAQPHGHFDNVLPHLDASKIVSVYNGGVVNRESLLQNYPARLAYVALRGAVDTVFVEWNARKVRQAQIAEWMQDGARLPDEAVA